jgi:hypothetical protein
LNDAIVERIAAQLEAEVPYEMCSKVLAHKGWVDVVRTIQQTCPRSFIEMIKTYTS